MALNKNIFGIYHPAHKLALLVSDSILLALAFSTASQLRLKSSAELLSLEFFGIGLIVVFSLFVGGAYTSTRINRRPKLPLNTLFVVIASTVPSLLFIYSLGPDHFTALFGRGVFPVAMSLFGVFAVSSRYVLNYLFHEPRDAKSVLLLGPNKLSAPLMHSLEASGIDYSFNHQTEICDQRSDIGGLGAVVILTEHSPTENEQRILLKYRLKGLPIYSLSDFCESMLFLVPVQEINNDWFIKAQGFTMLHSNIALRIKRMLDVFLALILLSLSLPVTLITAALVKISSPGPILFSQTRVGMNGVSFKIFKFRTMQENAESEGAVWAKQNDTRITAIGHFLRKSRIDELPQCWNILLGDMSLIGPRPERPEFTSSLAVDIPYYDLRHVVKPGLTGWAQVCYPYGASTEDSLKKLQFDLYYIKNYSLMLDLNILLRTVFVTVRRQGR